MPNDTQSVYLTFDDGPIPEVTPWVLDLLEQYKAKATFFCIGGNIQEHPEIFQRIIVEGHAVGNHTFHHLNEFKFERSSYLKNIELTETEAKDQMGMNTDDSSERYFDLFRPPYGKLKSTTAKILHSTGYKIVMWDVLSMDYDRNISEEKCLQNVLQNLSTGSIVVFHDSIKAERNLRYALPKVLEFIAEKGWACKSLKEI